jgi:hypothetical protein
MLPLYFFFVGVGGTALAVTPFAGGTTGLGCVVAPPTWLIGLVGPPTPLCARAGDSQQLPAIRAKAVAKGIANEIAKRIAECRPVLLFIWRSLFM